MKRVEGEDRGDVVLYALSTCVWCKRTKRLLGELGVAYSYEDVDLLSGEESARVQEEVRRWNPKCSFPTMVLGGEDCIQGFDEARIREKLGR